MSILLKSFEDVRTSLIRRRANRDAVANVIASEKANIEELKAKVLQLSDSILLMQNFTNTLRSDIIQKFEGLLTKGVRQVFSKDYKVTIDFQSTANSVYADFFVTLPDGRKINLSCDGGGLRDFISILQRILYIILEPTTPSRILFLDENLKALDSERSPLAFKFISQLTKELGIQVVFVTHSQAAKILNGEEGISVLEVGFDGEQSQAKLIHPQGATNEKIHH